MSQQSNKITRILYGIIAILAAIILVQNLLPLNLTGSMVSEEEIKQKVLEAIARDIGSNEDIAINSIERQNGLYKLSLEIFGQDYESYATLDGKYLFPQRLDLNPPEPKEIPKSEVPDVKLFVMSYCPFGNQAEELIAPVARLFGEKANIELRYIFYNDYSSGYPEFCLDEQNQYCAMHGIQELNQNLRELCVQKYQKDKLWDFVEAMNEATTSEDADEKWGQIAQETGLDVEKIKTCEQEEALSLLKQEVALTQKEYPVQNPLAHQGKEQQSVSGSPTLVINGVIYDGDRSTSAYQKAICDAFLAPPDECAEELAVEQVAPSGSCE